MLAKGSFDAIVEPAADCVVKFLELNHDCTFIATVVADNSKAIWLWQPDHPEPHTIILFQHAVQQVLWHPIRPDILLVTTSQKLPMVYVWHSETKAPALCDIPIPTSSSTKFQGSWLLDKVQDRNPFMLTTTKAFEVGLLELQEGNVVFQSLLQNASAFTQIEEEDNTTEEISTPSKPSRNGLGKNGISIMHGPSAPAIAAADESRF